MALPLLMGLSAAANIGGSIIGALSSADDRDKAQAVMEQALNEIMSVGAPPDLSYEIIREKLQQVGVYKPELEKEIKQEVSKVAQIQEDPSLRDAQTKALQILQQRSDTGLGAEDRAAFNQARREVGKDAEGKRQQILQSMAQRGMGGSGAELAAQLSAAQSGDELLAAEGDRIAAAAARNALDAVSRAGSLGGQIREQDFGVNKARSAAEDELNRFNVAQQISRQTRNLGNLNEAQMFQLREQQRIADENTRMANEEKLRQANAKLQNWRDTLSYAGQKSGALKGQAQNYENQAAQTQAMWSGIGQGVGGGLSAIGAGIGGNTGKIAETATVAGTQGDNDLKKKGLSFLA